MRKRNRDDGQMPLKYNMELITAKSYNLVLKYWIEVSILATFLFVLKDHT